MSLPIKQAIYDEWQESELKGLFDQIVHEHNAKFNLSGQPWKPTRRRAETTLDSADARAVSLPAAAVSKAQLMTAGAYEVTGADPCYSLIVPKDGQSMYLFGLSDGVVSDLLPFCGLGAGEYCTPEEVEQVRNGGLRLRVCCCTSACAKCSERYDDAWR